MKKYLKAYLPLVLIAGTIVILDQWTKSLVRANLAIGEVFMPDFWLSQYMRIVHWHNTGAAFGMFQDLSMVFTILSFVVILVIFCYYPRVPAEEWALRLAMSFQMGGATGNLIDRLSRGYVTDFVSVGRFPVWNVADACISIGTAILFFGLWWSERQGRKAEGQLGNEPEEGPSMLEFSE